MPHRISPHRCSCPVCDAQVLCALGPPALTASAPKLLEVVTADECGAVRAAAAAALGSVCTHAVAAPEAEAGAEVCAADDEGAGAERGPTVTATIAATIAALGGLLEDTSSDCRAAAVAALTTLGAVSEFEDEIGALMGDRDPAVRNAAKAALR